ncbi:MAG: hypothetical protein N3D85_04060 [Candidatus Bathyarchaeota archaeon]|nr:hypothetical protein [Candidatus Bathyarchaeota archaeon]
MAKKHERLEIVFVCMFSALIFVLFYFLLGANGLILGNDPAVHLERAQFYLKTEKVPLSGVAFFPPFYHLLLDTLLAFTGVTSIEQTLVLMKTFTALVDWLLIFSVYLVSAKFFGKKTAVMATVLMLFCVPLYEVNSWGGYTSILALAFMMLTFLYLALPIKTKGLTLLSFILAFSVVMSHEFALFLAVFILPPFIVFTLAKAKGQHFKALMVAILGGAMAVLIYYVLPILPYLDDLVFALFQMKLYQYQVPLVSFSEFMMNFGFLFIFAFGGIAIAFVDLQKRKMLSFFVLLTSAFIVQLLLSQAYLVGLFLPFKWFVHYMMPALVIFAAVTFSWLTENMLTVYFKGHFRWKRFAMKALSVGIATLMVVAIVGRFDTVTGKIGEAIEFYSFSDLGAYQAGSWIRQNSDAAAKVVAAESPGHWFGLYSGRETIAETDPVVEWNVVAECVLDLSYEVEHKLTMIREYEGRRNSSEDIYVSSDMVWKRIAYFPDEESFVSYRDQNLVLHTFPLSSLTRQTVVFDTSTFPYRFVVEYSAETFRLTKSLFVWNDTYSVTVSWQLTALNEDLLYASLFLSEYLDPKFSFDKAYVPNVLEWSNPWSSPSKIAPNEWVTTNFFKENFTSRKYVGVYDTQNKAAVGLQFVDTPDMGNVGALANGKIDAIRLQYNFFRLNSNNSISWSYRFIAFTESSYPEVKNYTEMFSLFDLNFEHQINVKSRSFAGFIQDSYIRFMVYSKERFDTSVLSSGWVSLVYKNREYVILGVKTDHPYVSVSR